jgi:quinoprotein glucose dehydrogenase
MKSKAVALTAVSTRYSALDQINATNARNLQLAWRWQALPGEGAPDSNFKATPPMIGQSVLTQAQIHDVSEYVAAGLPSEPKLQ